ncbi:hypothetical protein RTP6_001708 [Batrachochytrium dendrobatidis]
MKVSKLDFKILGCTGYDEQHPPSELHIDKHTPTAVGWQSERFCLFPQELVLHLTVGQSRICKIQLLAHHFKIPTRVEVHLATVPQLTAWGGFGPGFLESVKYHRLGFVSLDDNVANGYRARELKSIHLDGNANLIKLVLHKCHVNALNLYNQIGLVAINILGAGVEPETTYRIPSRLDMDNSDSASNRLSKVVLKGITDKSSIDAQTSRDKDLSFSVEYDRQISNILSQLQNAKEQAVRVEQYTTARKMKQLYTVFLEGGNEISRLSFKKRHAVQVEDFDTAEKYQCKENDIRTALYKNLTEAGYEIANGNITEILTAEITTVKKKPPSPPISPKKLANMHSQEQRRHTNSPDTREKSRLGNQLHHPSSTMSFVNSEEFESKKLLHVDSNLDTSKPSVSSPPLPVSKQLAKMQQTQDQRQPIMPPDSSISANQNFELSTTDTVNLPLSHLSRSKSALSSKHSSQLNDQIHDSFGSQTLDAFSDEMADPEPINTNQEIQFALPLQEFGITLVSKILSRQFRHRESGLNDLMMFITHLDDVDTIALETIRAGFQLLTKVLCDTRERTSILALTVFSKFMEKAIMHDKSHSSMVAALEENMFATLLFRAGDSNVRIKKSCLDVIHQCISSYHTAGHESNSLGSIVPALVKPSSINGKSTLVHHRHIKTRLDIILNVLQLYGVDDGSSRNLANEKIGLSFKEVLQFTIPYLEHVNSDVRDAASTVVATLGLQVGSDYVLKHLKGIRDQQVQHIKSKMSSYQYKGDQHSYSVKAAKSQKHASLPLDSAVSTHKSNIAREESDQSLHEYIPFDKRCIFCNESNSNFTEEALERHYWESCPLLTKCPSCGLITEVPALTEHLFKDCEYASTMRQCSRCKTAVPETHLKLHMSKKQCPVYKKGMSRCPLCQSDFTGVSALRLHLTTGAGCSASSRKPKLTLQTVSKTRNHIKQ